MPSRIFILYTMFSSILTAYSFLYFCLWTAIVYSVFFIFKQILHTIFCSSFLDLLSFHFHCFVYIHAPHMMGSWVPTSWALFSSMLLFGTLISCSYRCHSCISSHLYGIPRFICIICIYMDIHTSPIYMGSMVLYGSIYTYIHACIQTYMAHIYIYVATYVYIMYIYPTIYVYIYIYIHINAY